MPNEFVHLHTHTRFSVRDGLPSPQRLVDVAKMAGHSALAITDHGNMGGHYQFARAAADADIKAILASKHMSVMMCQFEPASK